MKKGSMMLIGLAVFATGFSQQKLSSGIICFTEISKLELKIEGDASQFSQSLPKEIRSDKELIYTEEASIYQKKQEEVQAEDMVTKEVEAMKIVVNEPENIVYTDLSTGNTVQQREFMTRTFLIEGSRPQRPWKFTGQTQDILGYTCQEAVFDKDSVQVSAWFTPSIPVSAGPAEYSGLPGMILLVDVGNGERKFVATAVEFKELMADELQKPRKGKAVTGDEFRAIVKEKMEEQGGSGEGGRMITIQISQ